LPLCGYLAATRRSGRNSGTPLPDDEPAAQGDRTEQAGADPLASDGVTPCYGSNRTTVRYPCQASWAKSKMTTDFAVSCLLHCRPLADRPATMLCCDCLSEENFLRGWFAAGLRGNAGTASFLAVARSMFSCKAARVPDAIAGPVRPCRHALPRTSTKPSTLRRLQGAGFGCFYVLLARPEWEAPLSARP